MIEVKIKENKYIIASEWCDVNFGQYIDLITIQEDNFKDLEKTIKLISALSDKPKELEVDLYNEMDLSDFNSLAEHMKWINETFDEAANKVEEKKFFSIEDKQYVIKKDYKKLSLGEMVSFETILKDPSFNHQEVALGILIRPIDKDGVEEKFSEEFFFSVINDLKYKINLLDVYKYINFFLRSAQISTKKTSKVFSVRKI